MSPPRPPIRRAALVATLLVLAFDPATAQISSGDAPSTDPNFARLTFEHLRAPLRPQGLTLLGLGTAGGFLGEDLESPEREVAFLDFAPFEPVSDLGNFFGDGRTIAAAAGTLWLVGQARDDSRLGAAGTDLASAFLATGLYTWGLKASFRSRRPSGGPYSFPSGHTASAFATAAVLHRHFGAWTGAAAYSLAIFTAGARMEDNRHYFTDVVFGAALGMAVAGAELPSERLRSWARGLRVGADGFGVQMGF